MNPSYFMNNEEKFDKKNLYNVNEDTHNQNRVQTVIKSHNIDRNIDNISNRLSARFAPAMKIDRILPNNNFNIYNNSQNTIEERNTSSIIDNKTSIITNSDISKKEASYNTNTEINSNSESNNIENQNNLDDILKKYGINIDEVTAEIIPSCKNKTQDIINDAKAENPEKEKLAETNKNQAISEVESNLENIRNNSYNLMDFDSIRKSIVKIKESDSSNLENEYLEKEKSLNNSIKKTENLELNITTNTSSKTDALDSNTKKADSFSSKVEKILESGGSNNTLINNRYSELLIDNQKRNTAFQLQNNTNKTVMFNLNHLENITSNKDSNLIDISINNDLQSVLILK